MLPINKFDKCLFIFLYNFSRRVKIYVYILAIYITINIYFGINDSDIIIIFGLIFFVIMILTSDVNNKLKKEFNSEFAGSSAFAEDVALAFELRKNEDKQTYILIPIKDRNNTSDYIAFKYNQDNTLTKVDVDYAMETNEDLEMKEEIIRFIDSSKEKPIYSDILSTLTDAGYNKDKANKIIQNGKNKYWKTTRIQQNNKLVFELLDNSDNQDKSQRGDIKNENK